MTLTKYFMIIVAVLLLSVSSVFAQTQTVEGHVVDDSGSGIEGVEVFLGLLGTTFEARYTCTDADGYYSFTDVPDVPLISAVGPDVDSTEICSRADYTNSAGNPLVIQFYDGQSQPGARTTFAVGDSPINYTVTTWDTGGQRLFELLIVQAHRDLSRNFNGDLDIFYRRMNLIIRLADRFEDRGRITASTEGSLIDNANNYLTIGR
ncbi:MAG: carboxypeptidase-like regulatory domain-containing protein [Chloroflexota bacterium]